MQLSDSGRVAIGALALVVAGFALGSLVAIPTESALALLGGAATLLLLGSRRGRGDD